MHVCCIWHMHFWHKEMYTHAGLGARLRLQEQLEKKVTQVEPLIYMHSDKMVCSLNKRVFGFGPNTLKHWVLEALIVTEDGTLH